MNFASAGTLKLWYLAKSIQALFFAPAGTIWKVHLIIFLDLHYTCEITNTIYLKIKKKTKLNARQTNSFPAHCRKQKATWEWGINQARRNLYQGFWIAFKGHLGYYPARLQMHGRRICWEMALKSFAEGRSFLQAPPTDRRCQAKPSQLLLLTRLIPSANTGGWMAADQMPLLQCDGKQKSACMCA